jgi:hypothetical protein
MNDYEALQGQMFLDSNFSGLESGVTLANELSAYDDWLSRVKMSNVTVGYLLPIAITFPQPSDFPQ